MTILFSNRNFPHVISKAIKSNGQIIIMSYDNSYVLTTISEESFNKIVAEGGFILRQGDRIHRMIS